MEHPRAGPSTPPVGEQPHHPVHDTASQHERAQQAQPPRSSGSPSQIHSAPSQKQVPPQPYAPQPYAPQPYAPQPAVAVSPVSVPWYIAKIVLACISIFLCIITLALAGGILGKGPDPNYNYSNSDYYYSNGTANLATNAGVFAFADASAPVIIALLWNLAELITLIVRRKTRRSIHPGGHVGVHLLVWLGFAAAIGLLATYVAIEYIDDDFNTSNSPQYRSSILGLLDGILALLCILLIIHFVLFVRACVETHRRNTNPRPTVIVIPAESYYASGGTVPAQFLPAGYQMPSAPASVVYAQPYSRPTSQPPQVPHLMPMEAILKQQQQPQPTNPHHSGYYAPQMAQAQSISEASPSRHDGASSVEAPAHHPSPI